VRVTSADRIPLNSRVFSPRRSRSSRLRVNSVKGSIAHVRMPTWAVRGTALSRRGRLATRGSPVPTDDCS
jgi:hypothetical protein